MNSSSSDDDDQRPMSPSVPPPPFGRPPPPSTTTASGTRSISIHDAFTTSDSSRAYESSSRANSSSGAPDTSTAPDSTEGGGMIIPREGKRRIASRRNRRRCPPLHLHITRQRLIVSPPLPMISARAEPRNPWAASPSLAAWHGARKSIRSIKSLRSNKSGNSEVEPRSVNFYGSGRRLRLITTRWIRTTVTKTVERGVRWMQRGVTLRSAPRPHPADYQPLRPTLGASIQNPTLDLRANTRQK